MPPTPLNKRRDCEQTFQRGGLLHLNQKRESSSDRKEPSIKKQFDIILFIVILMPMESKTEPHDLLVALLLVQSLLERRSEAYFQPYGLTSAQFNILNLLAYREGKMNQSELVDLLLVGKSSVSIVLNRMVRDGLVKREEHPTDRRHTVLMLRPKGRALWRKVSPHYEISVEKIFGGLPTSRRQRFFGDLRLLHDALLAEETTPVSDIRWLSHFTGRNGTP